jgi:peptidoglycan/LPS O-acetylase OafA/YrhL
MPASPSPLSSPLVDGLKIVASQLIVWHHLAFYGPMSDVVQPHAISLIEWLSNDARIAVQVFLVIGGFLAARSLLPRANDPAPLLLPREALALLWRRYLRLARPYAASLLVALACAWAARSLIDHPTIPPPPSATQLAAHLLMLQDVAGFEALSAGVWYVAIDLQLYLLLLLLCSAAPALARFGLAPARLAMPACAALTAASLFWLNLEPGLDIWAPYFFGAYGLGVCAQWVSVQPGKARWMLLLAAVVALALAVEWRSRIMLAGLTALMLASGARGEGLIVWLRSAPLRFLSRISYELFLIHYPVLLLVGAVVWSAWPRSPAINALGLLVTWLLSLGAAGLLHRWVQARHS